MTQCAAVGRMKAWANANGQADTQGLMDDEWEELARAALADTELIIGVLTKERDDLHDTLSFAARRFLHRGSEGQRCHCEDCSKVRRALSKPRTREFSDAEALRAEEILRRRCTCWSHEERRIGWTGDDPCPLHPNDHVPEPACREDQR